MATDALGLPLTGASPTAAALYDRAVRGFQSFVGDPVGDLDAAIEDSPDFTMAHAMKGWAYGLSTEKPLMAPARKYWSRAAALPGTERERGHVAAIGHLLANRWADASRTIEDVSVAEPRDALALEVGHLIDFYRGDARMLRDRIVRALPAWSEGMPGWDAMLGMLAFGLEETGAYARAEEAGRRAIALMPSNGWAQHAVAHVLEMQGRYADGIAWMRAAPENWSTDSFFAVHNWWHLSLYHLETGAFDEALALFDGPIYGKKSTMLLDMLDASALLWRLRLRGVDVGDRWQAVADAWEPHAASGNYAFNDMHAMMAFVGAGRADAADTLLEAQARAMAADDDNARFTREVGAPAVEAVRAFADGDYRQTIALLRPIRGIAHRFGGSHAQRDVLDLTLLEAAIRAGDTPLARALAAERLDAKPDSPLARGLRDRAAA